MGNENGRGAAVVLGAGMAGLIAARVLSEAYDKVTIVDRDPLPETARPRRGVPSRASCTCCWPAGGRRWTSSSRG